MSDMITKNRAEVQSPEEMRGMRYARAHRVSSTDQCTDDVPTPRGLDGSQ